MPFFEIFLKILGNGISQSFMLSLKCDHSFLYEFSILFSTVRLKLGHDFPQLIHRIHPFHSSKFFPIHKRDGKLEFLKSLGCTFNFFSIY